MDVSRIRFPNIKSSIDGLVQHAFDSARKLPGLDKIAKRYMRFQDPLQVDMNEYVPLESCLHSNSGPYEGAGAEFAAGVPSLDQCYDCGATYFGYD